MLSMREGKNRYEELKEVKMERKYNDLIGEILERSGEKDNYQGKWKGKPIPKDYLSMNTFQHFQKIAKDSGFLPPWLKLQKEISALVQACTKEAEVKVINKKIKAYNKVCPLPMQKPTIQFERIEEAKREW